jgi:hypothetical protein
MACVIGAGSSGLAVVKALNSRGIPFDCFEKSGRVGGNWAFGNENGHSSAYRSLHINTSRDRMAYEDFPMPRDYPDFAHHSLIAKYFEQYVDHFGLREKISFNTGVKHARRLEPGHWRVTLDTGEVRDYGTLVVANGHHWDPKLPDPPLPGRFSGIEMHSHDYVDPFEPHDMHGKRIVVVGLGNSAVDIACELSRPGIGSPLYLSARHGAWIIPSYLFGQPLDQMGVTHPLLPWWVQSFMTWFGLRMMVGKPWRFGLPRPDHLPFAADPTISQDLPVRLGRGDIIAKPGIAELQGDRVLFTDGSAVEADIILYCTGYKLSFPFFDPGFLPIAGNDLPLWNHLARPGEGDLFFAGLLQPIGASMPLAEAQARLIGDHLQGTYALPSEKEMRAAMERERRYLRARYVRPERHMMMVDFDRYLYDMKRERAAGTSRATAFRRRGSTGTAPMLARS